MGNWKESMNRWKDMVLEKSSGALARLRPAAEKNRLRERLQDLLPRDLAGSLPKNWDWRAILEFASQALQRRGAAFYGMLLSLGLSAFFLADLAALWVEGRLPEPRAGGSAGDLGVRQVQQPREEEYALIWERNLFSSRGLLPGDVAPGAGGMDPGGAPQPSTLPLSLIGTLILRDELKSIATIEDKGASMVYPVRVQEEIPSKIRVISIEPRRVTFLNLASSRREFVELPDDGNMKALSVTGKPLVSAGGAPGIERAGNNFAVPRTDLDRAFSDLNTVLTQARAVPHFENGVPAGYKLFQVMPDGFFGKLGLKDQDVICGIDNQPVNDPAKALELLGQLKTANHLELCIKRDGRQQNFSYDIR